MPRIRLSITQTVGFTEVVEVTPEQLQMLRDYEGCQVDLRSNDKVELEAYDLVERLITRRAEKVWNPAFEHLTIEKP